MVNSGKKNDYRHMPEEQALHPAADMLTFMRRCSKSHNLYLRNHLLAIHCPEFISGSSKLLRVRVQSVSANAIKLKARPVFAVLMFA